LTITVGPANADVIGQDDRAIQQAIDRVAARGGGTVRIKAGTYTLSNAVRLPSHMTLEGEGNDKTILKKGPPPRFPPLSR
jgi:polygalacturonase